MRSFVRRHVLYRSAICVWCHTDISGKEADPQVIPVSPEIYTYYWCRKCFGSTSVKDIIRQTRAYLSSEKGLIETQRTAWISGVSKSPYQDFEHSVKYLRGFVTHPPFLCAAFSLRAMRPHTPVIYRQHLALIILA